MRSILRLSEIVLSRGDLTGRAMLSLQTITVSLAVAGALSAYGAYGKFKKSRYRDLRAELCEERESLRSVIESLPGQLQQVQRSPTAGAESVRQRLSELEVDLLEAKLLGVEMPEIDYADLSAGELELRLVEILALSIRANALADKYRVAFEENAEPNHVLAAGAEPAMSLAAR